MAKEELIELEGVVEECLPNTLFRVKLNEAHTILAMISGKIKVEMSAYDLTKGRITYRSK